MSSQGASYNERAWAIDLIGHLDSLSDRVNRSVKGVGGEKTIRGEGGKRLFPDVLLFGDRSQSRILQGWELKMPDTGIDDADFRQNAEDKARALKLDSFLLWNVSCAHLYVLNSKSDHFEHSHSWSDLSDITSRSAVSPNRERWKAMASEILNYLNDMFDRGSLQGRPFIEAYKDGGITNLIMENESLVEEALTDAAKRDEQLRNEINLLKIRYKDEYSENRTERTIARVILSNWIGKILFGNILQGIDGRALLVSEITSETTPEQALELFDKLSDACNFRQIFSKNTGLQVVPGEVWNQLVQFNSLLSDLQLGSVSYDQISSILEATVEGTVRKLRGQYVTPIALSRLLVSLCLRNIVDDKVFDPFCGSGTIARVALEKKLASGVSGERASATVMASDRDFQAVQLTTFSLARPEMKDIPLRVFRGNAFDLAPGATLEFHDPTDGHAFFEVLEPFDSITSNLPFVSQKESKKEYEAEINKVSNMLREGEDRLPVRSDLSAYIPFLLHPLIKDGGRLGIIITNAWLGADWGDAFYKLLTRYYDIQTVITSGAGRWFKNSKVVSNILILEKKPAPSPTRSNVNFVVLERPLEDLDDERDIDLVTALIQSEKTQDGAVAINSVAPDNLARFRAIGLAGDAQFANCDWALDIPHLVPLKDLFEIRRGERRGMNDLFYPKPGHGIEKEYIRPLVKGPRDFKGLVCSAEHEAFACGRKEEELKSLGHTGALNWIRRFKTPKNVKKLSRSNLLWYQMNTNNLADIVMFINYNRLFSGRVNPPAFVDQRLVRLTPLSQVDIALCHALLNCTISMFFLEGMGFGRGEGVLDMNKRRIENFFHILDPSLPSSDDTKRIKDAFAPILERDILGVKEEMKQEDRHEFDQAVLDAFDLNIDRELVYQSLTSLVEIRLRSRRR